MLDQHPTPIYPAPKTSAAAFEEVEAVVLDVECNQVTAKHSLKDFVPPRKDPHNVPGRKGNVEEEAHPHTELLLDTSISNGVGGQHEVVIVEPDQRNCLLSPFSRPCLLRHSPHSFKRPQTKLSVDRLVSKPCLPIEHCPVGHAVEQRPESGVATAVVVILENRFRLDGNWDDAVRLESIRWPREASRSALGNLFR